MLVVAAMIIVFTVLYPVTILRVGFEYNDSILVPERIDGGTVYSGRIGGERASFTVTADGTVEFVCGDVSFGPYTAREDPSAVPADMRTETDVTGVELFERERLIFRGATRTETHTEQTFACPLTAAAFTTGTAILLTRSSRGPAR